MAQKDNLHKKRKKIRYSNKIDENSQETLLVDAWATKHYFHSRNVTGAHGRPLVRLKVPRKLTRQVYVEIDPDSGDKFFRRFDAPSRKTPVVAKEHVRRDRHVSRRRDERISQRKKELGGGRGKPDFKD